MEGHEERVATLHMPVFSYFHPLQVLSVEEGMFAATLERGQKLLEELLAKAGAAGSNKVGAGADRCSWRSCLPRQGRRAATRWVRDTYAMHASDMPSTPTAAC